MKKVGRIFPVLFVILMLTVACLDSGQIGVETQMAYVKETAVEAGRQLAGTSVGNLQKTVVNIQGTAVDLQGTGVAMVATEKARLAATAQAVLSSTSYRREFPDIASQDRWQVGAYFYPWWGPGRAHWADGYAGKPSLGEYDSAHSDVINRQIDWASGHGVDFFLMSWWEPGSKEDLVIKNNWLKSDLSRAMEFAILYEANGVSRIGGQINVDDEVTQNKIISDFLYLQDTYWSDSRYLRVDGKPVVGIYLTRTMVGNLEAFLNKLRSRLLENGDTVFLLADEVYWQKYHPIDRQRLDLFDAVTAYNMHASEAGIENSFTEKVKGEYAAWKDACGATGTLFVPGVIPGFDDTSVRPQENHPPIARSEALFRSQLEMGLEQADPSQKIVLITSWNEWHEDTSIEPAQEFQLGYLNTLKTVLEQTSR